MSKQAKCQMVPLINPQRLNGYRLINYCIQSSTEERTVSVIHGCLPLLLPFIHASRRLTFTFLYACVSEHLCVTIFWQLIWGSRLLTDFMSDHRAFDRWTLIHSKTCRCNSPVSKSHFSVRSPTQKPHTHTHTYRYNISLSQFWWLIYYTVACLWFQRWNINSHQTDVLYEVWER